VYSDYEQWLESTPTTKVRLYEATLLGATNQIGFTVRTQRGDTPLGATDTTFVSFVYRDPTNGEYQLEWHLRGQHRADFLKLSASPKKVLLQPFGTPDENKIPRLKIVGFEGVESQHVVVAEPGQKPAK
jgi:hypothetical protein